jgi:hypothetical protein
VKSPYIQLHPKCFDEGMDKRAENLDPMGTSIRVFGKEEGKEGGELLSVVNM